ncbi:hypothetical protein I3A86_24550, partial [Salmonella enterica]|nr:hypothetical protein [Salmonella enterica]
YLAPKLATDAKVDLGTVLSGVTAKTFRTKRDAILTALDGAVTGKLIKGADLKDARTFLAAMDADMDDEVKAEDEEEADKAKSDKDAKDEDTSDKKEGAADEEPDDKGKKDKAEDEEPEDKKSDKDDKAMDAKIAAAVAKALKGTVTTAQMQDAIKLAADGARKEGAADAVKLGRAISEARDAVRPWAGDLAGAFDAAVDVHRAALKAIGMDAAKVDALHA